MVERHPSFPPPPDPHVPVWRYMDLTKFVWMLQMKALYFCRADRLGDPYEGYYTAPMAAGTEAFVRFVTDGDKEKAHQFHQTVLKATTPATLCICR